MCTSKKKAVFLDTVCNLMCTSRKRGLFLEAGGILMCTSKKSTDILEVVKVLMCASKIWDLFLETDSKDEGHFLHFCGVYVGGGHKASRASL